MSQRQSVTNGSSTQVGLPTRAGQMGDRGVDRDDQIERRDSRRLVSAKFR